MSRRARLRRSAARVALLAYVLGTLFGTAHLALTRHAVCAAHGEVVHGEVVCAMPTAEAGAADGPRFVGSDAAADEHEHCATAFALRADLADELSPATACDAPPARAPREHGTGLLRIQDDLLSFAPKQSPPA